MITNEQRERVWVLYIPHQYGYKKVARALGLTRDQVRGIIQTAQRRGIRQPMTKFSPDNDSVKNTVSIYEDRDLSGCSSDADKIAYLQNENRLLRALLVEYQKEFLPEALAEYPAFQTNESEEEASVPRSKKKRSLKKKPKRQGKTEAQSNCSSTQ